MEGKSKVLELREGGMTYGQIAKELDMTIGTVKSICSRAKAPEGRCKECGKPIRQTAGKRKKVFCSDVCRWKWHREHPEESGRMTTEHVCENCGKAFSTMGNKHQRYCSQECYREARYGRR